MLFNLCENKHGIVLMFIKTRRSPVGGLTVTFVLQFNANFEKKFSWLNYKINVTINIYCNICIINIVQVLN